MMTSRQLILPLLAIAIALAAGYAYGRARAQVLTRPPDELRFEVLLSEPVARAGERSVFAGTSALVVRDRRSGQCYVAITFGRGMAMTPGSCEK